MQNETQSTQTQKAPEGNLISTFPREKRVVILREGGKERPTVKHGDWRLSAASSELCKNGWTNRDAVWGMDSGGPREACLRCGCTLAPPNEYDWTVHVRRRCSLFV